MGNFVLLVIIVCGAVLLAVLALAFIVSFQSYRAQQREKREGRRHLLQS